MPERRRYARCAVHTPEQRSSPDLPVQRPEPDDVDSLPEPDADLSIAATNTRTLALAGDAAVGAHEAREADVAVADVDREIVGAAVAARRLDGEAPAAVVGRAGLPRSLRSTAVAARAMRLARAILAIMVKSFPKIIGVADEWSRMALCRGRSRPGSNGGWRGRIRHRARKIIRVPLKPYYNPAPQRRL